MPMPSWAPTPEAALTSTLRAGSAPAVPKLPIASRSREECAAIVASLSTAEGEVRRALEGLRTQLATGPTVSRAAAGFLRSAQSDADKLLARVEDLRRAMLALGEGLEAIDA
jgi:hypothetical protein